MALPVPVDAVLDRVKTLAGAASRPVLTDSEVIGSIQAWPRVDRYGVAADVDGWEPTWDINAAVAELWGVKAGKVAGDFNFKADDASYDKGKVLANCLEMQAQFAAKGGGSANTGLPAGPLGQVVVNG